MGFDNECILNIQSLAGEYFCPVCRLLVYPDEALQSLCTHLYCKPCLTYVVSTTQACPYDGYLVTESDSKPLVESNKGLAETIGKITVHCLFHRSGCTWQGPLSECTSHCSSCAFGNSPVVCNRCGIQIVHSQVQEHAQNCPGVQPQAQQAEGAQGVAPTSATATGDQTQTTTQAGAATSQVQTQTTVAVTPGKEPDLQANSNSQAQAIVQAPVPTAEQWYQQQQQYQQYYQQYPAYNPSQQPYQQYYPYQQQQFQAQPQGYVQPQPQVQTQAQSQPQLQSSHPPAAAQPQNHGQVNSQQQTLPPPQAQPYPQAQPHTQPLPVQTHSQQMQMPQYQQPHSQMQHTQSQIQLPVAQPQPQSHPQAQLQTQVQHHPQPQTHSQLQAPQYYQSQTQHTSAHAVTGHHSYPQSQPHQQMPLGGPPQHPMHVLPHGGAQPQMQNQFPQQTPQIRPLQSHATIPNQQPSLLPSQGQVPNVPTTQQPPVHPHALQPGVPVYQYVQQQPMPQQYVQQQPFPGQHQLGPFAQQQQLPVQSQIRAHGPPHLFQQHSHAYTQPHQNVAILPGMKPHQPQNLVGRPMTPNHGVQSLPYQQSATGVQGRPVQLGANQPSSNQSNMLMTNSQVQLSSEQHSVPTSKQAMSEKKDIAEKSVAEPQAESSSQETAKMDSNTLDETSGPGADVVGVKIPKSETDLKYVVDQVKAEAEDKTSAVDTSAKEFMTDLDSHGEPVIKQIVKEDVIDNVEDGSSANVDRKQGEHSVVEDKEIQGGPLLKTPQFQETASLGEQSGKKEKKLVQAQVGPQGPVVPQAGGSTFQQRPSAPSMFQAPPLGPLHHAQAPGHLLTQFRPQGSQVPHGIPVSGTSTSFGRGPGHHGPPQHAFELPSVAPQGPYNQGFPPPSHVGGPPLRSIPPSAFDSHAGMMARGPPYGPEGQMGQQHSSNPTEAELFPVQRPGYMDGRRSDSHLPGGLLPQPSGIQSNPTRVNGASGPELQDERFKPFADERLNPFPVDPARRVIDRGEFEEDLKQFPRPSHLDADPVPKHGSHFPSSRPLDRGPHSFGMDVGPRPYDRGLNYDPGLKLDPMAGSAQPRFLPSYVHERPVGLHEDAAGRSDATRTHPDFRGPVHGYGRRRMDGLSPRSPVRDYPGIPGFGGLPGSLGSSRSGPDDIDGREFRRFGDPIGNSFHESRFPVLPSHLRRGEFEGPGRSGDLIGQDFLPGQLRRGEHSGPHNLRLGEAPGFGGFSNHARMGDLAGPGNFPHPRLGEPGFRSSFSHHGFPSDGGIHTGGMESFENSRKRKPISMGWCRICKVDCETVDGLDLHSQTREHQKMAMDMVVTIKQNAKKQKLISGDRTSADDASKSRNANSEGRGRKH